jgi:hypothetical protein
MTGIGVLGREILLDHMHLARQARPQPLYDASCLIGAVVQQREDAMPRRPILQGKCAQTVSDTLGLIANGNGDDDWHGSWRIRWSCSAVTAL